MGKKYEYMREVHPQAIYPTPYHQRAAEEVTAFFKGRSEVEAVLLTCSCTRGKATKDSCVDIAVLLRSGIASETRVAAEAEWQSFYQSAPVFAALKRVGAYSHVDLHLFTGCITPSEHGWTSGADSFELEIGNLIAYAFPLFQRTDQFTRLQETWLPYYPEDLRRDRLSMVLRYCRNNLEHIPVYVERKLYFQAFNRLYHAFGEFLQALFISKRVYPIAYDKWIHEQIVEILELPQLYSKLPKLFEISQFESTELVLKGQALERLVDEYIANSRQ